jgi:hypothetical protein
MESIPLTVFTIVAVVGFRSSLWLVVGALAAHGLFDSLALLVGVGLRRRGNSFAAR